MYMFMCGCVCVFMCVIGMCIHHKNVFLNAYARSCQTYLNIFDGNHSWHYFLGYGQNFEV